LTVTVGKENVGVAETVGVNVSVGVRVSVGVKVMVGVYVSVGVKVNVGVGVFVHESAVAVKAVAVRVACCSGEAPQAEIIVTTNNKNPNFFIINLL